MPQPPRSVLAALAVALPLALAGCGGDDAPAPAASLDPAATSATPSALPTAAPPASPAAPSPTVEAFDGTEINVAYAGGEVSPPAGEVTVPLGGTVRITITSDVAEEYHVHTYDLQGPIAPGSPTQVEFVASIPGQHEVELHDAGTRLLELVVR